LAEPHYGRRPQIFASLAVLAAVVTDPFVISVTCFQFVIVFVSVAVVTDPFGKILVYRRVRLLLCRASRDSKWLVMAEKWLSTGACGRVGP
jgi:hypothetical protein